jgi:hypothetical protein
LLQVRILQVYLQLHDHPELLVEPAVQRVLAVQAEVLAALAQLVLLLHCNMQVELLVTQ